MSFRVVLIENETKLQLRLNSLIVQKEEKEIWIPLDDIMMIVIDNMKTTITARMLCALSTHNIGVIVCDQDHLPMGYYSSYDNYSRISKSIQYQIQCTKEAYNCIWKDIVKNKISNQRKVLLKLHLEQKNAQKLLQYQKEVVDGDVKNREAHAAKVYFNTMMGHSFSRGNKNILLNSGLDYGYAIIRSYLAKLCVGYGLNSQIGIHHRSEYNRFNLIDDLIEPFRPFVDYYAYNLLDGQEYFKREHRIKLINILNHQFIYNNKKMYMSNALENYVTTYAAVLAGRKEKMIYPDVENYLGDEDAI